MQIDNTGMEAEMDSIQISSRLYDYTVTFTDDFMDGWESNGKESVYVVDRNVYQLYSRKFEGLRKDRLFFAEAAESNKNMDTVMEVIRFFQKAGVKKNWKVFCFGGGITQDITTMAADLYLRNIEWVFYPTTLLSMCDSCIGGKCGINLGEYKNQIGVFYPPKKIVIDIRFLDTLSEADYINGWGELLKFSLTEQEDFFEKIKREPCYIPCSHIAEYIRQGLLVKKKVIEEDEFESDQRRILNYGHTFGHALEAYTRHEVPHGKGVIWGIDVANYIAWKEGLITEEYYLEIKSLIRRAFLKEEIIVKEPEVLFEMIKTDKKVKGNTVSMALLEQRSRLGIHPMHIDEKMKKLFLDYIGETHEYYYN